MAAVSLAMPTKLWDSAGRECGRTFLYLQRELLIKLSNLIGLFPWSLHVSSPKPTFPLQMCSRADRSAVTQNNLFNLSSELTLSPCCSLTFFHLGMD